MRENGYCEYAYANGKKNVINTVLELEEETFILGIIDADFWHLNGINPESKNILVTDLHDVEIMMLNTKALERIIDEFGNIKKIRKVNVNFVDLLSIKDLFKFII